MAAFAPTPFALAALATAAVPELTLVGVQPGPENPDFYYAVARDNIGRAWVIRMPRHDIAGASQEAEIALLQSLAAAAAAGGLPFEVPRPRGYASLPDGGRAVVYPKPPGEPLDLEQLEAGPGLASNLGRALAALHELPATIIENAGLPSYTAEEYRARLQSEVDEAARTGQVPASLLSRWERRFDDVRLWRFSPTVIHGDIASENLLAEHGRVATIISFTSAQVSDPAEDLAPVVSAARPEASATVLESYRQRRTERADDHLATRTELLGEMAIVRWLLFGVRHHDQEVVADAHNMLVELEQSIAEAEVAETERIRLEEAAAAERKRIAEQAVRAEAERLASEATEAARAKLATAEGTGQGGTAGLGGSATPGGPVGPATPAGPGAAKAPVRTSVADHGISVWGARSPDPPPQWNDIINSVDDIPPAPGVRDAATWIIGGLTDAGIEPALPPAIAPALPPAGPAAGPTTAPEPGTTAEPGTPAGPGTTAGQGPGAEGASAQPSTTRPEPGPANAPFRTTPTGPQPTGIYSRTGTTGAEPESIYSLTGESGIGSGTGTRYSASQPADPTESRAPSPAPRAPVWATVPAAGLSTPPASPSAGVTPGASQETGTEADLAARDLGDTDPGAPAGTPTRLLGDDSPTAVHPPVV